MVRTTPLVWIALVMFVPTTGSAVQQQAERRSPAFQQRIEETGRAMNRLRAETRENWRLFTEDEIGVIQWADFTAGADAFPATLKAPTPRAAVQRFLASHGDLWGRPSLQSSLRHIDDTAGRDGRIHLEYQQIYRGVVVEGATLLFAVERDPAGMYAVRTIAGRFHPDIDIGVVPAISEATAVAEIAGELAVQDRRQLRLRESEPVILLVENAYILAWRLQVESAEGVWVGRVDASDGSLISLNSLATSFVPYESASPIAAIESRVSGRGEDTLSTRATHCTGRNVFFDLVHFHCTDVGSGGEMRDLSNPSANEIHVHNVSLNNSCATASNISFDDNRDWAAVNQGDEVSAIENANKVLNHYRARYDRDGMFDSSNDNLVFLASTVSRFNAGYCPDPRQLAFFEGGVFQGGTGSPPTGHWPQITVEWEPTAAALGLVAHEFQHGVNDAGWADAFGSDFVALAINEGLSDYFALAMLEDHCLNDTIIVAPSRPALGDASHDSTAVHPGCGRSVEPDVNLTSSFAAHAEASNHPHEYGLIGVSALWDARKSAGGWKDVYDNSVMDAVTFWLPRTPTLIQLREAIVTPLKNREHSNQFGASVRPSYITEYEFHQNEVGSAAVLVTLTDDGLWEARIEGSPGTVFRSQMFAGNGINNDGSIADITDSADNEPEHTIPGSGVLTFFPGQQGWTGAREHTGNDGHDHSVRIRINNEGGCLLSRFGCFLFYYDAWQGTEFPTFPIIASGDHGSDAPRAFAIHQAIGSAARIRAQPLVAGSSSPSDQRIARDLTSQRNGAAGALNVLNGVTRMVIAVPETEARGSHVRVRIYDLSGRLVLSAVDEVLEPGHFSYSWNARDESDRRVPPGVYLAVMEAPGYTGRTKLIVTR